MCHLSREKKMVQLLLAEARLVCGGRCNWPNHKSRRGELSSAIELEFVHRFDFLRMLPPALFQLN